MPDRRLRKLLDRSRRIVGNFARTGLVVLPFLTAPAAIAQMEIAQLTLTQGTNLSADISPADGRIVMDLLGSIWVVPAGGGAAEKVSNGLQPASRPQWSPNSARIAYQTVSPNGSRIWMLDLAQSMTIELGNGASFDQHPEWHPSGERVAFSSARGDGGFDIWETHLATGLSWRLSQHPGDETEPAWSADGQHLAYVRHVADQWRLVLRRHGRAEQDLVISDAPLASPSWRPDGSLLTYLRDVDGRYRLEMVILSNPPLIRQVAANQDFFLSPVSWLDRMHLLYTADGVIKSRGFNDWKSKQVPFTAEVRGRGSQSFATRDLQESGELPILTPPDHRLVIRAARIFDGITPGYRNDVDVLIEGGRIAAVEYRRDWNDATVLDLGDATIMPGFIDTYAALPERDIRAFGLALLACGVTTIVAERPANDANDMDAAIWETREVPGPRLLRAAPLGSSVDQWNGARLSLLSIPASASVPAGNLELARGAHPAIPLLAETWVAGLAAGADLLLGADTLPASPRGRRYQDIRMAAGAGPAAVVSGLADAATPGLAQLLASRQAGIYARWFDGTVATARRFSLPPTVVGASTIVVGSKPNGLPAGLALHAEMRALAAAGLESNDILQAVGANASDALGFGGQLGRVAPGALADLVLVSGDPLQRIADALNVVAVVRNGRFYSLVRLLEDAAATDAAAGVE